MAKAPALRADSSPVRLLFIFALLLSLITGGRPAYGSDSQSPDYQRAKLLAFVLRQDLSTLHFSHKKIDDALSKEAFSQYLKQLDGQKLLLLKEDVDKLSFYSDKIDEEIKKGTFELPLLASEIILRRAAEAEKMTNEILAGDFDFSADEYYESDPDKVGYCGSTVQLRDRWRRYLKLQVLQQYLSLRENKMEDKGEKGAVEKPEALWEKARQRVLRTHKTFFSRIRETKEREIYERFFNAVAKTFDPHTEYMPPQNKEDFDIDMKGTLEGIGATLKEEDGYIKVISVVPGSPAARNGNIHAEDIILKVGEKDKEPVDITFMGVRDAVKLIRGKKGTQVNLSIKKPGGNQLVVSVVRDVIKLEDSSVKGGYLKDERNGRAFGYIKIPSFYRDFENTRNGGGGRNSTDDVLKELKKLKAQGISGLIIDLRNNGGGALIDAIKTAGLFIKEGPIVQVKSSDGKISVLSDDNPDISYDGPIVILVNKFSASASEILAGALQDYGRAIVMGGRHTHGKGTVQTIIDLDSFLSYHNASEAAKADSLGALRLTIQKFYRITGESTQYRGVTPDIILPDQFQGLKSGEQFLDYALPWDTIQPVPFSKWTGYRVDLSRLRAKSGLRVKASRDFADISEESRELLERQDKTLQSLNLDDAARERKALTALKAKHDARKSMTGKDEEKDRDTSKLSESQRYQIWLKEAQDDPYIREGISVLGDVITGSPALRLDETHASSAYSAPAR